MNRYLIGSLIVCLLALFLITQKACDYKQESERHESNEYALMNPSEGRVVNLTEDQFEDRLGFKIDSMNTLRKGDKMKHVQELTTVKSSYAVKGAAMKRTKVSAIPDKSLPSISTGSVRIDTMLQKLSYTGGCFNVEIIDTTLNISFADTIQIVNYLGKRSKKFLFIRYGKRHEHVKAFSKCGTIEVSSVKVVKE